MPTYTYRRADGSTFEIEQRITAPALTDCPTTGQSVSRIISGGAGLVFKGSGFYVTDYVRKSTGGGSDSASSKTDSSSTSSSTSDSGSADSADKKPKTETKASGTD